MRDSISRHLPGNPFDINGFVSAEDAQVEATLALAYEQRTTALVSLLNTEGVPGTTRDDVLSQLAIRLGLDAGNAPKSERKLDARKMF